MSIVTSFGKPRAIEAHTEPAVLKKRVGGSIITRQDDDEWFDLAEYWATAGHDEQMRRDILLANVAMMEAILESSFDGERRRSRAW
jgi:hypothetical protein